MGKPTLREALKILKRRKQHLADRIAGADQPSELSYDRAEHGALGVVLDKIERERDVKDTARADERRARR